MEAEYSSSSGSDTTNDDVINSFATDAKSLLVRFCKGEMFEDQFRQSDDVLRRLVNRQLNNHFNHLEERVSNLIDERLCYHFDRIENLVSSKSCWMSPT